MGYFLTERARATTMGFLYQVRKHFSDASEGYETAIKYAEFILRHNNDPRRQEDLEGMKSSLRATFPELGPRMENLQNVIETLAKRKISNEMHLWMLDAMRAEGNSLASRRSMEVAMRSGDIGVVDNLGSSFRPSELPVEEAAQELKTGNIRP